MRSAYEIRNKFSDRLTVWVEPWCHPYYVPTGSVLRLSYVASRKHPLHTELTDECLIVWTNSRLAPTAELDGKRIEPDFS